MLAGVLTVAYVTITDTNVGDLMPFLPQAIQGFNEGVIALIVNLVVMLIVSLITRSVVRRKQKNQAA